MNPTTVISCPTCLRQYEIDVNTGSSIGQCNACGATFKLVVPRLADLEDKPIVLRKEVGLTYDLIGDACEGLARALCGIIVKGGHSLTVSLLLQRIARFTSDEVSIALRGLKDCTLTEDEHYIVRHMAYKTPNARLAIRAVFEGVLHGIDWGNFSVTEPTSLHCPACRKDFETVPGTKARCPQCRTIIASPDEGQSP